MEIVIARAQTADTETVVSILSEAAKWLSDRGDTLWEPHQIDPDEIKDRIELGMFWVATVGGEPAGCFRFQYEDAEYWDDVPHADSAFVHKVAVKRAFSGGRVSKAMLDFAKQKARDEGKMFLRLDCARREKLCGFYEDQGFLFHSVKVRKPYSVNRYQFKLR